MARYRENRPKIRVWLETAVRLYGKIARESLILRAANIGNRDVILSGYSLSGPKAKDVTRLWDRGDTPYKLPFKLSPGRTWETWDDIGAITRRLKRQGLSGRVKVWGWVGDQTGKTYKSKPIELDVGAW
jgi:hypothetical protein